MLDGLIRWSLRNRLFVVLTAAALLVVGAMVVRRLPVDVFPDLNRPTVTLLTEAGGLAPEEVELLVTRPLELAMAGAPGVERVRSQSGVGLSVVTVEFGWSTDVRAARQQVSERLAHVRDRLPDGADPAMGPVSSIMGEILLVGLASHDGSVPGPQVRRFADLEVVPVLQAIPGVSQVIAIGGGVEQIEVLVDPVALAARGITLAEVREVVAGAQGNATGGFLERRSQEWLVRILARTADAERLAQTPVTHRGGVPIPLSAVAEVRRGVGVMRGDAGVNAHSGVILSIQKQPGASTIALTEHVREALDALAAPPGVEVVTLFRQADFVEAAIANVEEALRDGAILVAIVLVLFLLSWRTTLITLTAIPLSFVVSALVLEGFGWSVNTMTLGGLAVAVGELVDDAIVDVENVFRRLKENALANPPRSPLVVVAEASAEIRGSIVFSTILVVLVFVPLFALDGIEGRLFAPLGVAYVTSIAASLLVSLTVTPAMCAFLLPSAAATVTRVDGRLVRGLKALDRAVLERVLPRPGLVIGAVTALVAVAVASLPLLGTRFLPAFNEGTATINLLATPGTSLHASNHIGQLAERLILTTPEVASVGRRTGRAELDEHAEGVHYSEIDVDFTVGRPRAVVLDEIRRNLATIPGIVVNVGQPIAHRLDHLLSGVRAEIAIKVFGEDLGALRATAERVRGALEGIDGLVDLQVERQVLVPQLQIDVNPEAALRFGVTAGRLAVDLQQVLAGVPVAQVNEGLRATDLVVRLDPDSRANPADVPLVLEDGHVVTLGQIADVRASTGPNQILHENGQRRIVVSANTAGRDPGRVVADIERALDGLGTLPGVRIHLGGQIEQQRAAGRAISGLALLALVGMYAVLYSHLGTHGLVLQVLVNVPLALIGAVAALHVTGAELSVATMVGFVTLCGIASRNTILMLDHYRQLMDAEGLPFGPELVIRGSLERLVPVLMTALTAGLALVPLALAGGEPGKEILTPVAQVILGGLTSSTLLDMVVTPTVFLRFGRASAHPSPPSLEVSDKP